MRRAALGATTSISTSPAACASSEPAADLAAAAALVSSLAGAPLPADAVYFGEICLSGAVRPVAQAAARLKEAQKLGFARAVVPEAAGGTATPSGLAGRSGMLELAERRRRARGPGAPRRAPARVAGRPRERRVTVRQAMARLLYARWHAMIRG